MTAVSPPLKWTVFWSTLGHLALFLGFVIIWEITAWRLPQRPMNSGRALLLELSAEPAASNTGRLGMRSALFSNDPVSTESSIVRARSVMTRYHRGRSQNSRIASGGLIDQVTLPQAAVEPSDLVLPKVKAQFLAELGQFLETKRVYPWIARKLRQQGEVLIAFSLSATGEFSQTRILKASGISVLDEAGLDLVRQAGRFKPIPPSLGTSDLVVTVPIRYDLNSNHAH